jgi:hypothetical protein
LALAKFFAVEPRPTGAHRSTRASRSAGWAIAHVTGSKSPSDTDSKSQAALAWGWILHSAKGRSGETLPSLGPVTFTVPDAHLLALEAHEGQVDKQGRDYYLAHLLPIAEALRPYGPHAEMAGALHDSVEDTRDHPDLARRYDFDRLRVLGVPDIVVEAIDAVTRRPGEPYISGLIYRSAAHPLGRLVKLADNKHNLAANDELAKRDPERARSLREGRYRPARRILLAAEAADLLHGRRIIV